MVNVPTAKGASIGKWLVRADSGWRAHKTILGGVPYWMRRVAVQRYDGDTVYTFEMTVNGPWHGKGYQWQVSKTFMFRGPELESSYSRTLKGGKAAAERAVAQFKR